MRAAHCALLAMSMPVHAHNDSDNNDVGAIIAVCIVIVVVFAGIYFCMYYDDRERYNVKQYYQRTQDIRNLLRAHLAKQERKKVEEERRKVEEERRKLEQEAAEIAALELKV